MKNGKLPTRNQKIMMKSHGLDSEKYLVVKDTQLMGVEAIRRGKSLDDVKDSMLDIHLAAMQTLTEQIIREKEESDGI